MQRPASTSFGLGEGPASDGAVAAVGSKDPQSSPPLSKDNGGASFWPQWSPFILEQPELNNGSIQAELPKQTQVAAEDDFRPYFLDIFLRDSRSCSSFEEVWS